MFSESSTESRDRSFQIIPSEIAERFVAGKFLENTPVEFEDKHEIVFRLFKGDERYSGIPATAVYLDYHKKKNDQSNTLGQLHFDFATHPVFDGPRVLSAQMHFEIISLDAFRLVHRYVNPEQRRRGIGTQLLRVVESWFTEVVLEKHSPITCTLQTGQISVIRWVEKMGFSVTEDERELRREIDEHPERFFEDEVIVSEESQAQGIVKDLYMFRVGTKERYMDNGAIRLTFQKRIFPDVEDSSVDVEAPSA